MEVEREDLIIFGATGFTGKYVVEAMANWITKTTPQEGKDVKKNIKWGIAGRSLDSLKKVLQDAQTATGYNTKDVTLYQADVKDDMSLKAMASKCKVLLNCVGPYRFLGEQVVKACIDEGTHYVDVSGEPEFLETVQLKYHEKAEKKQIYIIGACGFDSIPTDCGVTFLQQIFANDGGEMNSVESFMEINTNGGKVKINHATWLSAIHGVANAKNLRSIRKELYKNKMPIPEPSHKLKYRGILHKNKVFGGYYLPFPGSDISVARRSQRHFYYKENKRPAQVGAYVKIGSWWRAVVLLLAAVVFGILAQFKSGQNFLSKWASWVSFGYVTHEGPKDDEMKSVEFTFHLIGKGWESQLSSPDDKHVEPPKITKSLKVTGYNPGYGATCVMILQSALTILSEKDKMPSTGGVYPPGAAFAKTSLIDKLNESGVKFEVTDIKHFP